MKKVDARQGARVVLLGCALALAPEAASAASLDAQPCLRIPLQGLPETAAAGERILVTADLTTDCNYKVVDEAELICRFAGGLESRHRVKLVPRANHTQGQAAVELPRSAGASTGECFIQFRQCNVTARTCGVHVRVSTPLRPDPSTPPVVRSPGEPPGVPFSPGCGGPADTDRADSVARDEDEPPPTQLPGQSWIGMLPISPRSSDNKTLWPYADLTSTTSSPRIPGRGQGSDVGAS